MIHPNVFVFVLNFLFFITRMTTYQCTFPPVPTGCSEQQFQCDNGQCIEAKRTCDRVNDCDDSSDEKDCGTSTNTTSRFDYLNCSYLQCLLNIVTV